MIAKYIILSNIISVVSDNILRIRIQETLLILTKFIVLLHTSSAFDGLLVRYKVYSSDPRKCLCAQAVGTVNFTNFSTDPAPCRKDPNCHTKLSVPTTRRNLR